MTIRRVSLVTLFGCLLLSASTFALTTLVTPSQDVSFRDCAGVSSTSTIRTLDVYGSACMNALLRFDLAVLGSAGMDHTESISLELPIAAGVSGIELSIDYAFSSAVGAWDEKSSLATLSGVTLGNSLTVPLAGQTLVSVTIPLPTSVRGTPVMEVRLGSSASSAGGITANQVVQIGSRRGSLAADRSRLRIVTNSVCVESTDVATTSCLSSSAFGFANENAGFCIGGATGFCDCHSGMYGSNCAINGTDLQQCSYATFGVPQNLATNFPPLIARPFNGVPSNRYDNNRLILNIESPLVARRTRTEMFLGNPATTGYPGNAGCRYPGYFWDKQVKAAGNGFTPANDSLSCVEAYTAAIPWGTALQCGWNQDNTVKPGFTTYRSTITVQHTEQLPGLRGAVVERNLQHIIPIQVAFPRSVVVSTNISVFSFVNLQAAIVAQKVLLPGQNNIDSPYGRIVLATSLQWPFQLTTMQFEDLGTGQRYTFTIDDPHPTTEGSFNVDCVASASAGNANPICNQLFGHIMLPFPNVCTLNGRYRYTFGVDCRNGDNCPLGATNDPSRTATVDIELKSEDFCAQIEIDIGARGTLRVFSDNTYTTPKSAFLFENGATPQRAFFRADVTSDQASINRAFINQVAVYPSNDANARNLIFTLEAGAALPTYNFQTTDGIDFAFFSLDVIPASFPGVAEDANVQFTVEAVVGIEFEQPTFGGAKKRGIQYKTFTFDRRAVSAVDTKTQTAAAAAQIGLAAPRTPGTVASAPKAATGTAPTVQQGGVSNANIVASSLAVVIASLAFVLAMF